MKINTRNISMLLISILFLSLHACKDDDDDPDDDHDHDHNEEELITTVEVTATDPDGYASVFYWRDIDGPGGNDPVIDDMMLKANLNYTVAIEFLDESGDHAHDITHEIEEEDDEHLICFESNTSSITVARTDSDGTYEVGLESTWTVGAAGTGDMTITLKHQPDVKNGSCDPGETDVEVTFPVTITE